MARKGQVSIQDSVENNEEFEAYVVAHADQLICMEVYSEFCGPCLATGNAIRKGKLELGGERIAMVKAMSDHIDKLARFKYKSEPVFLFIEKGLLTRAMFGPNGIELCRIIEEELKYISDAKVHKVQRLKFAIDEMLPEEAVKIEMDRKLEEEHEEASERLRVLTLAARKRRVCHRLAQHVKRLNFIMFWPKCHQAYYDLYEKWDEVNITVGAKEEVTIAEESIKEALYMSDVDPNEACVHALTTGVVLVVLFKMFDTDNRDFVKLLRHVIYEEIPVPKEDAPPEKQLPPIPAYERYASISKTAREVRRERYNTRMAKLRKEEEERQRLAAEQARIEREAAEEEQRLEKQRADEERMRRIQAGLPAEPEPEEQVEGETVEGEEGVPDDKTETMTATEDVPGESDEEKVEAEQEFDSDLEIEGEDYIPPGGLFVPGLYSPANELAKANGLAFFFPKVVTQIATIESEFLPPHVLIMFTIDKRHDVQEIMKQYADDILAVGVFVGEEPQATDHVAYSIKQYDKMERLYKHKDRLALMVSRRRSLALLQLACLNPCYISTDIVSGERDCLELFPVGYGDDFEEELSVVEEEIVEDVQAVVSEHEPVVTEEVAVEEEEEEEDE